MRQKCCLWTNKNSFIAFIDKTLFCSTAIALTICTVLMIFRLDGLSKTRKSVLATFCGLFGVSGAFLGILFSKNCRSVNYLRLCLKVMMVGMAVLLFKVSSSQASYQGLVFLLLQVSSLKLNSDELQSQITTPQMVDNLLWLLAGVACLIEEYPEKLVYASVGLNCVSPTLQLVAYLLQPCKRMVIIPVELSPTQPSILISSHRAEVGTSNSNKKGSDGQSQLSFLDSDGFHSVVRPRNVLTLTGSRDLQPRPRPTKKATDIIRPQPVKEAYHQKRKLR